MLTEILPAQSLAHIVSIAIIDAKYVIEMYKLVAGVMIAYLFGFNK